MYHRSSARRCCAASQITVACFPPHTLPQKRWPTRNGLNIWPHHSQGVSFGYTGGHGAGVGAWVSALTRARSRRRASRMASA